MATRRKPKPAGPDFVRLSSTGRELTLRSRKWAFVLDRSTGLIWTAEPVLAERAAWPEAMAAAENKKFGKLPMRGPSVKEQLSIVDYELSNPAVDPRYFRVPSSFFWTSTRAAWARESDAWLVHFGSGHADDNRQNGTAFVLACRSARASQ